MSLPSCILASAVVAALSLAACVPDSVAETEVLRAEAGEAEEAVRHTTSAVMVIGNGLSVLRRAAPDPTATLPYLPVGCAQVTRDGATFTFVFDGCRVRGRTLRGRFVATVTGPALDRSATISEVELDFGDARVAGDASVDYQSEDSKTIRHTTQSRFRGVRADGKAFALEASLERTLELDTRCLRLAGTFTGELEARRVTMTIEGFRECAGGCPEAGARLTVTRSDGRELLLSWDGSPRITVTADGERIASIPLTCAAD